MPRFRVVTWNIAEGTINGTVDQMACLGAISGCLFSWNVDIVLLNEVCTWNPWTYGGVNQIEWLAQRAGYPYRQWTKTATLALKGAKYVAVLSRVPLLSAERLQHSAYWDGGGYATLHVTARLEDRVHHIFSARFTAYDAAENARSHAALRDIIGGLPPGEPVLVGGDFNTGYARWDANGQPTRNDVPSQYTDFVARTRLRHVLGGIGWDSPSPDDHLLVRGPYAVTRAERVGPAPGTSDHPWILAELSSLDGLGWLPLDDGSLMRQEANPAVYVIFGGAKFWVPDPGTLGRLYGGWANVQGVPANSLVHVPTIPCSGTILREENNPRVWLIENGRRRHITTPDVLVRYGGWDVVRIVPDNATASLVQGDPVV